MCSLYLHLFLFSLCPIFLSFGFVFFLYFNKDVLSVLLSTSVTDGIKLRLN